MHKSVVKRVLQHEVKLTTIFASRPCPHAMFPMVHEHKGYIKNWFISNKLSLNAKKTNYTLFYSLIKRDDLPLASILASSKSLLVQKLSHQQKTIYPN